VLSEYQLLRLPELPIRSTLYCLKPIGIGSEFVESLTSFISRLACEHRVSLSCLLEEAIAPLTGKQFIINGGARVLSGAFSGYFRAINSTGGTAAEWIAYLEHLTMRSDLSCLTLRKWRYVFSQRELLRPNRAWCPECYGDQLSTSGILYDPLIWSMATVTVCAKHRRALLFNCQHCYQKLFHLSPRARPGHCYRCRGSLKRRSLPTRAPGEWELWTARAVAQIIACTRPGEETSPSNDIIARTTSAIVEGLFNGNAARFAQAIGKQKSTVWGWCHNGSRMLLNDLLNLCYCLHIDPSDFLCGTISIKHLKADALRPSVIKMRQLTRRRQLNSKAVEQQLREALEHGRTGSMQKVAQSLGFHKRFLYRHFPDLCPAIAYEHKQVSTTNSSKRPQVSQIRQSG